MPPGSKRGQGRQAAVRDEIEPRNGGNQREAVPFDMRPAADIGADFYSQATAIEAARATAEVQAMIVTAKRLPRSEKDATDRLLRSCGHPAMADRAFYSYERGGKTITGPSVKLAREALRCWGNASAGITELRRVERTATAAGYSEMQAWAWDLETMVREVSTFFAPHLRERRTKEGDRDNVVFDDEDARDIREGNANMAGRVVREMIWQVLPPWYRSAAEDECHRTLVGDPAEFKARVQSMVDGFAQYGVKIGDLEEQRGIPREGWAPVDLSILAVLGSEIRRGERLVEDVFPGAIRVGRKSGGDAAAALAAERDQAKSETQGKGKQDPTPPAADAATRRENMAAIRDVFRGAGMLGNAEAGSRLLIVGAFAAEAGEQPVQLTRPEEMSDAQAARAAEGMALFAAECADHEEDLAGKLRELAAAVAAQARGNNEDGDDDEQG